jgi:LacI family transcriptional regulator
MRRIPKVILLIESSRAAGRGLLRGIADYARHYGPWSFFWEPGGLEKAWPTLRKSDADGIILRDIENVDEVIQLGLPAVIVEHRLSEVPGQTNVVTDSSAIGQLAADHLLACGFRHFAYCGYAQTPWSEKRLESFCARIRGAGFAVDAKIIPYAETENTWRRGRNFIAQWLKQVPKPVGLLACNDDLGQEIVEVCRLQGMDVPDKVAVIGVDNDELICGLSNPPMSSVAVNFERAGYEAAGLLSSLMQGHPRPPERIVVRSTHVVPRRSTDVMAVEDASLARALRFIRDHGRENISVADAARAAGLSRRVLEKRFRSILKQSVLEEIRRIRAEHIVRMLVETNLQVSEIAGALGFEDVQHFARYFKSLKGQTPLAYRKAHGAKQGSD